MVFSEDPRRFTGIYQPGPDTQQDAIEPTLRPWDRRVRGALRHATVPSMRLFIVAAAFAVALVPWDCVQSRKQRRSAHSDLDGETADVTGH